jgi:hypothetical protein
MPVLDQQSATPHAGLRPLTIDPNEPERAGAPAQSRD